MQISLANLNYTLSGMQYKKKKKIFDLQHDSAQLSYRGYTNKKYQFLN